MPALLQLGVIPAGGAVSSEHCCQDSTKGRTGRKMTVTYTFFWWNRGSCSEWRRNELSLQSLMASDQSVAAAFQPSCATNQLSGDPYHSVESNRPPIYPKLLRQCGFRTEHGTEIKEFQVSPTCAPTCLYVVRVPPVLIYPQVTRRFWQSVLFLTKPFTSGNKKESIYCTVKRNLAFYIQNYFTVPQKIIRLAF